MMGQHTRSESLFYYFRLEDHIPDDHLLRLVDRHRKCSSRSLIEAHGGRLWAIPNQGSGATFQFSLPV